MEMFVPKKSDKEVISVRLSAQLLNSVDEHAEKYKISRNELINQCLQFALDHIEEK